MKRTLSVIIPAYNEEKTVQLLLQRVVAAPLPDSVSLQVVITDDCSTDNTAGAIEEFVRLHPGVEIVHHSHERNKGKGAAVHTCIASATGDYILVQDADLEYDPQEYQDLLRPILDDVADVVYGSRFSGGKPHRILFLHAAGNKLLTFLSNAFTNLNLTDMETCFKVFRAEHLKSLNLEEQGFGFEPEVTAKISRIPQIRIHEIAISYQGRTYAEGKKISWRDGIHGVYCILKYNVWKR